MIAKFDGQCLFCEQAILKGDPVLYVPDDRGVYCGPCARDGEEGTRE